MVFMRRNQSVGYNKQKGMWYLDSYGVGKVYTLNYVFQWNEYQPTSYRKYFTKLTILYWLCITKWLLLYMYKILFVYCNIMLKLFALHNDQYFVMAYIFLLLHIVVTYKYWWWIIYAHGKVISLQLLFESSVLFLRLCLMLLH